MIVGLQLTTTLNVYIHDTDAGLGRADAWDEMLGGANGHDGPADTVSGAYGSKTPKPAISAPSRQ